MLRYQLIAIVTRKHGLNAFKGVVIDYRVMLTVINGILVFAGGCLAIEIERQILGRLRSLAGLVGEAHQVKRVGISLFRERLCEFHGFGVTASLGGFNVRPARVR